MDLLMFPVLPMENIISFLGLKCFKVIATKWWPNEPVPPVISTFT